MYSSYTKEQFEALKKKIKEIEQKGGVFHFRSVKISTLLANWAEEKGFGHLLYKSYPITPTRLVVIGEEMSDYDTNRRPKDVTHCALRNSSKEYDNSAIIHVSGAGIQGILECIDILEKCIDIQR